MELIYEEVNNKVVLKLGFYKGRRFYLADGIRYPLGQLLLDFINLDYTQITAITNKTLSFEIPANVGQYMKIVKTLKAHCLLLKNMHPYLSSPDFGMFLKNLKQSDKNFDSTNLEGDVSPAANAQLKVFIRNKIHRIRNLELDYKFFNEVIDFCFCDEKFKDLAPIQRFYIHAKRNFFDHPDIALHYNLKYNDYSVSNSTGEPNFAEIVEQAGNENFNIHEVCNGEAETFLYYEFIKLLSTNARISRCKSCKKYFIIAGRSDTVYCGDCKNVGPGNTYRKKVNEDPIMKLHQRAYKRQHQRVSRKKITNEDFNKWGIKAELMRKRVQDGDISFDKYKAWIEK
jgi:hypothetical protein